uniref:IP16012p n=1 Tax=Drosophila melanogaster TaxID=7227 RepID=Q1RL04_DROME|nr:IP16012p [Drosophila melanogaster]
MPSSCSSSSSELVGTSPPDAASGLQPSCSSTRSLVTLISTGESARLSSISGSLSFRLPLRLLVAELKNCSTREALRQLRRSAWTRAMAMGGGIRSSASAHFLGNGFTNTFSSCTVSGAIVICGEALRLPLAL